MDDIENLIYVGQNSKLDIGGMLFSGILIASLGAVMDVIYYFLDVYGKIVSILHIGKSH